tara:strand:+ start:1421 stop:1876 length:456 start_codon:yes stop_codon:yes gene_type:complete
MSCHEKAADLVKAAIQSSITLGTHGWDALPDNLQPTYGGLTIQETWDKIKSPSGSGGVLNNNPLANDILTNAWENMHPGQPHAVPSGLPGVFAPEEDEVDTTATPADPNPSNWMSSGMLAGGSKRRKDKSKKFGMQSTILTGGSGIYSNTA